MKAQINRDNWVQGFNVPATKGKEDVWELLKEKIENVPEKRIIPFYKRKSLLIAATILFAALLFTFLTDSVFTTKNYVSEAGEQQIIELPDDSRITLNPLSECVVNYSFLTGKRIVKLNGEALFEVHPGKDFNVKFEGGKVNVLGTVFMVSAYKKSIAEVNCLSGKVEVKTRKNETTLKPSTGVILNSKKELKPEKIENSKVLDELNGNYSWKNEPLQLIFEKLENRFGYKIQTSDSVKMRKFSGQIKMEEMQKACEIVSFAMDLSFSVNEKNKTVIFENSK